MRVRFYQAVLCISSLFALVAGNTECVRPRSPDHGFISRCTNGVKHMSVCSTICEPGYVMDGDSRMLCWCGTRQCLWRGSVPTCKAPRCAEPDFNEGRVRVVDRWPSGFIGTMEMSDIPDIATKLRSGWSMVLVMDRPLGPDATLTSWNAKVLTASYDRRTFTLANMQHNADLSTYLETPSFRWAFAIDNLKGEVPQEAYLGLFNSRVTDASCYKPPKMIRITSLPRDLEPSIANEPEETPTTITAPSSQVTTTTLTVTTPAATLETTTTTVPTTAPESTTTTTPTTTTQSTATTTPTTATITTTTATMTTTSVTETTSNVPKTKKKPKKKPKNRRPRRRKGKKGKNKTTTNALITTITPTMQLHVTSESVTEASTADTPEPVTVNKMGGRYCILQIHEEHYKTQDGWEDHGVPFFSGNAILNVTDHLRDWSMLMVFDSPIEEIQVWSVTIVEKSEDGLMWTFGPHDWNLDLYIGLTDINFIAKQTAKTAYTPVARVYLCSLAFTEGDTIVTSPDSPAQIALAGGTLGQTGESSEETQTEKSADSEEQSAEEELIDIGSVKRWKKPKKVSKRCLPSAPNGVVPTNQQQTKPDFKPSDDGTPYNYNELLHKSLLFFEAQRAGKLPKNNRIGWRSHSTLKDGCEIGVDLSGGWFDAGDHVKFSLPMASSVSLLAWGGLLFKDAYKDADELKALQDCVKWPAQYLIKSHISRYEFVGQVGSGHIDHVTFGRPEEMKMKRPVYVLTPEKPGTEPTAEAAAALSAVHLLLKNTHKHLAKSALKHAEELFEFADRFRGNYHDSIQDVKDFYFSFSGYKDELVWAAAWLYKATGKSTYLYKAKSLIIELGGQYVVESEISWDRKLIAAQILLANLTGEELYRKPVSGFLSNVMNAKKTPKGLMWLRRWGPNRYAANAAFMVLAASTLHPPLPDIDKYVKWATKQIHLVLGDIGRSYVVGFGKNYPERVHHRGSTCKPYPAVCNRKTFYTPQTNYFVLYGALVGGPDQTEKYSDNRVIYEQTEVACDYNAGFQGAVAGLKHLAMKKRTPAISYVKHDLRRWSNSG